MKKSLLLIFASSLTLAACNISTNNNAAGQDQAKAAQSGIDKSLMDTSAAPGDDFDKYANGKWEASVQIPPDKSSVSLFSVIADRADKRETDLVNSIVNSNPASGSDDAKIADYYKAYTNTQAIEQRGAAPIKADVDKIEAIPDKAALAQAIGQSIRADADPINDTNFHTEHLFGIFVTQALGDPTTTVPYVIQGGLGLPDREYYLSSKPEMAKIRADYTPYVAKMLSLAGMPDAKARAQKIVALEHKIAEAHESLEASQSAQKANNPWSRADFDKKAPGVDWGRLFGAAQLGNQQNFIVWQPGAVTKLAALVQSQPLDVWKDWLAFHRINEMAEVLPKRFDDAHFAFYGTEVTGTPEQRSRDKRAIDSLNAWLGDAVGKRYAQKYFPASYKADIEGMVKNIKSALQKRIQTLTWMNSETKREAEKKVASMIVGVGYPDKWRDYSNFNVDPNDAYGNLDRAQLANYEHQIGKIGKPVDRSEWWMDPQTVNAVNLPLQNALNFPAAILDKGFYDPECRRSGQLRWRGLGDRSRDQPQLRQSRLDLRCHGQAPQLVDSGRPRPFQAGRNGARQAI